MSGHAPEFPTIGTRIRRWVEEGSDWGLAAAMLGMSVLTFGAAMVCAGYMFS